MQKVNSLSLFRLIIAYVILCFTNIAAYESPCNHVEFEAYPKTYVRPEQVEFFENLIFIRFSDDLILPTEAICSDTEGLYIISVSKSSCG